jgi:PAS domain S-box-containing protein
MDMEEHKFNEEILNSLAEGVLTVDKEFKINFFNKAAEQITGYNKNEVIGQFCKYVFKCELCASKCPIGIVLESGEDLHDHNSSIEIKNGNRKSIRLNAAILKNSNEDPVGGVISFRDLTELLEFNRHIISPSIFWGIIGHGKAMREIFDLIQEIAESDATVLIQGESGTGKELVANAIQATSLRSDKQFLKVNCSVFPSNLLASELFGHVKGSFTDAFKDRPGRFEVANGGTIFLDEVAEMPLQTQIQLLRVLQEGTFERVGESITRKTDVRVIAATNINIQKALSEGKLREDLFYRLNVIPIHVPPLRERKEDIPYLVKHFISEYARMYKKNINDIDNNALEVFLNYSWPGNVRELENAIEYLVVRCKDGKNISLNNLPSTFRSKTVVNNTEASKELEKDNTSQLVKLLDKHHWNKTKVAQELGIGRTTLWRMLKNLSIEEG